MIGVKVYALSHVAEESEMIQERKKFQPLTGVRGVKDLDRWRKDAMLKTA